MKFSEITGEKAIELTADLIEPAAEIMADKDVADNLRDGKTMAAVKAILKSHSHSLIQIMALLDGRSYEEECESINILTLPKMLVDVLNDKSLMQLFSLPKMP